LSSSFFPCLPSTNSISTLSLHDALPIYIVKNIAIWLIVALVLMTVFNQFGVKSAAEGQVVYSQFIDQVKQGQIAKVTIDGRVLRDRKSTRLNSSHVKISYAVFCLKKKKT